MNIFILDNNPVQAAVDQCDKHVIKMILETAQMLSTIVGGPYKPTHANHPCTIWARSSTENFLWLKEHGLALCAEYTHRYGKRHKCEDIIWNIECPSDLSETEFVTPFAQAMPEEFRSEDAVASYRAYYHTKQHFCRWTNRNPPSWWKGENK